MSVEAARKLIEHLDSRIESQTFSEKVPVRV